MTRIEISYYADDQEAERHYFREDFLGLARADIERVRGVVNGYGKLTFQLGLKELLETFEFETKHKQLFILQPNLCCLIYAKNQKRGNYSGFKYEISARTKFDYQMFLLKNALPGPGSDIHCVLEPEGAGGGRKDLWLTKSLAKSQIPGFRYQMRGISRLPRPAGWSATVLPEGELQLGDLREKRGQTYFHSNYFKLAHLQKEK